MTDLTRIGLIKVKKVIKVIKHVFFKKKVSRK